MAALDARSGAGAARPRRSGRHSRWKVHKLMKLMTWRRFPQPARAARSSRRAKPNGSTFLAHQEPPISMTPLILSLSKDRMTHGDEIGKGFVRVMFSSEATAHPTAECPACVVANIPGAANWTVLDERGWRLHRIGTPLSRGPFRLHHRGDG